VDVRVFAEDVASVQFFHPYMDAFYRFQFGSATRTTDLATDKAGIDVVVAGRGVDEKFRYRAPYGYRRDDCFVELCHQDLATRKYTRGWATDPTKRTDYVMYVFALERPMVGFLIPYGPLRERALADYRWRPGQRKSRNEVPGRAWDTYSVPVSWAELKADGIDWQEFSIPVEETAMV
jgi:hypothetical protein